MSAATSMALEMDTTHHPGANSGGPAAQVVVCLGPWCEDAAPDSLTLLLRVLRQALGERSRQALVAYPVSDPHAGSWEHEGMPLHPYLPSSRMQELSLQTAGTYLSLFEVMRAHSAPCGMLLGAEAQTLQPAAVRGLLDAVLARGADAVLARYQTGANQGLINASVLHPLSRAVFGTRVGFPLAIDVALSGRMAERMASAAQRHTAAQPEAVVWLAAEAAVAGYALAEVDVGVRDLPRPAGDDLSSILNTTAASLFSEVEAKATFWQRTRPPLAVQSIAAVPRTSVPSDPVDPEEIADLVETFRIAYGNLQEIWSLVLPPQTLLGLKRLSAMPPAQFAMPDALWVRVIYDFVLAHRLRTINRGHLMGALTPLYLAWVASHIVQEQSGSNAGSNDSLARAFETDKPYLVSRWRWPDRFNP